MEETYFHVFRQNFRRVAVACVLNVCACIESSSIPGKKKTCVQRHQPLVVFNSF